MHQRAIKVKLSHIAAAVPFRKVDYLEAVLAAGRVDGDYVELTSEVHAELRAQFTLEDWPMWAVVVALFANKEDRGVGDTLWRELGSPKGEKFKAWHESVFGVYAGGCQCDRLRLNRGYAYAG